MADNMGSVDYNKDVTTEGKWNMGAFIFQQMDNDMIKMADFKDTDNFLSWFKRYKTLHNKVKATLIYFDEKNNKNVHADKVQKMDDLRSEYINNLSEYYKAIHTNNDVERNRKMIQIISLIEKMEQTIFSSMPYIGAWLPTKKSFTSWEDELDADYG